jgi:hypothetical protein
MSTTRRTCPRRRPARRVAARPTRSQVCRLQLKSSASLAFEPSEVHPFPGVHSCGFVMLLSIQSRCAPSQGLIPVVVLDMSAHPLNHSSLSRVRGADDSDRDDDDAAGMVVEESPAVSARRPPATTARADSSSNRPKMPADPQIPQVGGSWIRPHLRGIPIRVALIRISGDSPLVGG